MVASSAMKPAIRCTCALPVRAPASRRLASTLVYLEQRQGKLTPSVLSTLTAASSIGGDVHGVVLGGPEDGVDAAVEQAKSFKLGKVFKQVSDSLAHTLAEPTAPVLASLVKSGGYTHVLSPHSAVGKNIFPRLAALLDSQQVSDVMKIESEDTFIRPFYAGNAIATVKSSDPIKVLTIRPSAFEQAQPSDAGASVEDAPSGTEGEAVAQWVSEALTKSERPDLGSASRVVSGGRGLKNKENFDKIMYPLADALGAAVGASRAAVDSGFADNSLQVGQTGKVVAPELYLAVGISGAIQHLAGMKDAKVIASINKDPECPMASIADMTLVQDLFTAAPELTEAIQKA